MNVIIYDPYTKTAVKNDGIRRPKGADLGNTPDVVVPQTEDVVVEKKKKTSKKKTSTNDDGKEN